MPFSEKEENGTIRLEVDDALTIYDTARLREVLLKWIGAQRDVAIDLSEANKCDAAGLQLLCSIRKTAEHTGKKVRIAGVSRAVLDTMAAAGLKPEEIV